VETPEILGSDKSVGLSAGMTARGSAEQSRKRRCMRITAAWKTPTGSRRHSQAAGTATLLALCPCGCRSAARTDASENSACDSSAAEETWSCSGADRSSGALSIPAGGGSRRQRASELSLYTVSKWDANTTVARQTGAAHSGDWKKKSEERRVATICV
jgi:hypothetical protein